MKTSEAVAVSVTLPFCWAGHYRKGLADILPSRVRVRFTFHAAWKSGAEGFLKVLLRHPAPQLAEAAFGDGHCISLLLGNDDRLAFNSGHVPGVGERQPAAKIESTQVREERKALLSCLATVAGLPQPGIAQDGPVDSLLCPGHTERVPSTLTTIYRCGQPHPLGRGQGDIR